MPQPAAVVAVLVVVVAAIACGRMPLLATPGPEAGLVLAVVGGVAVALSQAARGSARPAGFFADAVAGAIVVAIMVAVFLVSTAIGGALTPSCSENAGRFPMLAISVPVLLLQSATGAFVGRMTGQRVVAVVAAVLFQAGIALWVARGLYVDPGFRVASHYFVVVSGDLLRGASLPDAALAFRFATLLLAVIVTLVGGALWPAQRKRGLVSAASAESWPLWVAAVVMLVLFSIVHVQARRALQPSRQEFYDAYSLMKRRGPIVVHADPLSTTPRQVDALLAEATLWHARLADRLGPLSNEDIHVFVHANSTAQAKWTGASHVDFTMPWRREIHVSSATVPHRTLGHELAHVVAGEKSDTLLRVPARFAVLHAAAVTEGVAMALTPELVVNGGLTLQEQAAAMRRAGKAPDLRALFSFTRFFAEEPGRAYVAAGALVEQLVADAGADAPRVLERLYRGEGRLDAAVVDVDDLLRRHAEHLDALPLPRDAEGIARARFSRPSVLDETCDPDADEAVRAVRALARTGDPQAALARAAELEGSPQTGLADGTLVDLVDDVTQSGHAPAATSILRRLVDDAPSPSERALRSFALGRALWRQGSERDAVAVWAGIDAGLLDVDVQRQLTAALAFADVAGRLADQATVSRAALAFFCDDRAGRDGTRLTFAEAVGAASVPGTTPTEPAEVLDLARYVLGRQLVLEGALHEAEHVLRGVVERRALVPVFHEQAVLALGVALVRDDRPEEARSLFVAAAEAAMRPAMRMWFRDRAERAGRAAKAPKGPTVATASTAVAWGDRLLLGAEAAGEF